MPINQLRAEQEITQDKKRNSVTSLVVGGIGGAIEAFANQPLWAWKTRQQYGDSFTLNPRVLYRGVLANVNSMAIIIAIRLSIRDAVTKFIFKTDRPSVIQNIVSAFSGGVGSAVLTSTIELGMTQQQKVKVDKRADNFTQTYSRLIKEFGISRAVTGAHLVALRDGCFSMGFMALAPHLKSEIKNNTQIKDDIAASIISGVSAGTFAAFISHPADTIKSIQHAKANTHNKNELSTIRIAKEILAKEGWKGLYKGFFWRGSRVASGVTILAHATEKLTPIVSNIFGNN